MVAEGPGSTAHIDNLERARPMYLFGVLDYSRRVHPTVPIRRSFRKEYSRHEGANMTNLEPRLAAILGTVIESASRLQNSLKEPNKGFRRHVILQEKQRRGKCWFGEHGNCRRRKQEGD